MPMREQPDIVASVVAWGASVSGTAREILAGAEAGTDSHDPAKDRCRAFHRMTSNARQFGT